MRLLVTGLALACLGSTAAAQTHDQGSLPVITIDGTDFYSWQAYLRSPEFARRGKCMTPARELRPGAPVDRSQSHCSFSNTSILPQYDSVDIIEIPVVVHIIENTSGQGAISDAMVDSQIKILNEDFLARTGTNGANGFNTRIHFFLARFDPAGNPTNGITRSVNNNWFNDSGSYWNSLAWDTDRYLNIYTNSASGALGYVPNLPQGGIVGSNQDRVVVLWSSFGLNGPIGPPFNLGRTTTHEVGHYLGLEHTFSGGCAGGNCYNGGDLICDTNSESSPNFGCGAGSSSCGNTDPVRNYMNYSDDGCMEEFTEEQSNRMRCTIENWRVNLARFRATSISRNGTGVNPDIYTERRRAIVGLAFRTFITQDAFTATINWIGFGGPTTLNSPFGQLLVLDPYTDGIISLTGENDIPIPANITLVGQTFHSQGARWAPGVLEFTNALDFTVGY